MVIRFRKVSMVEQLVLYIFVMPFTFFFLMEVLHVPSLLKYTLDVVWLCLLLLVCRRNVSLPDSPSRVLLKVVGVFFACTIVGFLLNYQSPVYYLWGLRNNLRFFVFFFACILFMSGTTAENCLRFMDSSFYLNIPVALFQYFVMGKSQDYLGGIFGTTVGCNGYLNIFFIIVITKSVLNYMNQKETSGKCLFNCASALMISVIAELKIFFVEFLLIIILAAMITRFSFRKLWVFLGSAVGIILSARLIGQLFPQYRDWFSIKGIWEIISSTSGYTSRNDMNRMTAISISAERFLQTPLDKLFGLGLGNCDYASFDFLVTPFYRAHNRLHYMWFSSAFTVLETGFVGLILYISFFLAVFFQTNRRIRNGRGNAFYCQLTLILSVLCPMLIIYNNSMRNEAAYMMYFVLALPYIRQPSAINCKNPKEG